MISDNLPSNQERKLVHQLCQQLGLFSFSTGPPNQRQVHVTKVDVATKVETRCTVDFAQPNLEITDEDRKLFIRETGLPIPVWKSPYFEYFIDLYQEPHQSADLYDQFVKTIQILQTRRQQIKSYTQILMDKVCRTIKSLPAYQRLETTEI